MKTVKAISAFKAKQKKQKALEKAKKKKQKARTEELSGMKSKARLREIMRLVEQMGGGSDGGHHKQYLIDQIVRVVQGDNYDQWRYDFEYGDGTGGHYPDQFLTWDEGIP